MRVVGCGFEADLLLGLPRLGAESRLLGLTRTVSEGSRVLMLRLGSDSRTLRLETENCVSERVLNAATEPLMLPPLRV